MEDDTAMEVDTAMEESTQYHYNEIKDSTFESNTAAIGGAMVQDYFNNSLLGHLEIHNTDFKKNRATTGTGGAVFLKGGSDSPSWNAYASEDILIKFKESRFDSNEGGALYTIDMARVDVNTTVFVDNTQIAGMNGGAVYSYDSFMTIDYTTFANNTIENGDGDGGQLYVASNMARLRTDSLTSRRNTTEISHCSFEGKQNLTGDGGTIYFSTAGTFKETCTDRAHGMAGFTSSGLKADYVPLTGVDALKESAARNGGYMYLGGSANVTISKCQVHDNAAARDGGAFYVTGSAKLYLDSVMLRDNKAQRGGGAFIGGQTDSEQALLRADKTIGLRNEATEAGENVFNDRQVVKLKCGDLHLNTTKDDRDVSVSTPAGGPRGVVGGYRLNDIGCAVPTPNPTFNPTPLPTGAPTFYPTPAPSTSQPTVKTVMVTTSSEITLSGVDANDVGKEEKKIIKKAIADTAGVDQSDIYNLEISGSTRRLTEEDEAVDGAVRGAAARLFGLGKRQQRRQLTTSEALVSFDIIMDLLLTNYTTSAQLSTSVEELVTEAVESGDLVTSIETLATAEGNTVMSAVTASVIVSTSYTTTEADAVTAAPTAVYEYCPPLFMSPNELATYMYSVNCLAEEGDHLGETACGYVQKMKTGSFPTERCKLSREP